MLQKPVVCSIVPVVVHPPLPQYQQEIGNYYANADNKLIYFYSNQKVEKK